MEANVYISQRREGGHILATSPECSTLAGAIRWSLAAGNGWYMAGVAACFPSGGGEMTYYVETNHGWDSYVHYRVSGGEIVTPERGDWDRFLHGTELQERAGRPIPRVTTLWVIKPGDLSSEGSLRDPGTCVTRSPHCGDQILDVLTIELTEDGLEVKSERQRENRYRWTADGPHYDRDRRTVDRVSISGRAGAWGTLGDDSYDAGTADYILEEILLEAVLGLGEWKLAPIYYDATEDTTVDKPGRLSREPITKVDLTKSRRDRFPQYLWDRLAAASLADDRRPLDILEA